jgi:hypothetical protein
MSDGLDVHMRKVGHFLGRRDGVDDRSPSTLTASLISARSSLVGIAAARHGAKITQV